MEQTARDQQIASATREEFANLAGDLEAVWGHPATDARLKKRIVRTLIEEVMVDVDGQAGEIIAIIHWKACTRNFAFLVGGVAITALTVQRKLWMRYESWCASARMTPLPAL